MKLVDDNSQFQIAFQTDKISDKHFSSSINKKEIQTSQ